MTDTLKSDGIIGITLNNCNDELSKYLNSAVITIRSPIYRGLDDVIRSEVEALVRKEKQINKIKNKFLPKLTVILETTGGSIEVVERISNVFRNHFREVIYIVPGYAYSAGTVLVMSGDDILMDYYSVLGPIDPQIEGEDGRFRPGMGYLYMYESLIEKSKSNEITSAELIFLTKRFDPGDMFQIEQAQNHSIELIEEWLPKYKFKDWSKTKTRGQPVTRSMKRKRAQEIASILGNAERWHSHGRGITLRELRSSEIKLEITDFGQDLNLNQLIRQYYDLFIDYGRKTSSEYSVHTKYGMRRIG